MCIDAPCLLLSPVYRIFILCLLMNPVYSSFHPVCTRVRETKPQQEIYRLHSFNPNILALAVTIEQSVISSNYVELNLHLPN